MTINSHTFKNIQVITDNDLCISCGACKHACPFQVINIKINETKGFYEPVIHNEIVCATCEEKPCLRVCPSYEEDFVQLARWTDPTLPIGNWHSIYTGYSTDDGIRHRASSGGIIKELCRYYLESDRVDGVITLRHIAGLEYEPDIYKSVDDVLQTPGSIYHNVSSERAIEILKSIPGRFLLISIPCQLTGIYKWMQLYPEQMVGKVVTTIGLICGWMFTRHSLRHFAKSQGVNFDALQNVTYRGGDKFGALVLETKEQNLAFTRRPDFFRDRHAVPYWIAFSRTYNNKRCLLCIEHLNFLADIVVGDAWLDAFKHDTVGTSIIIVRNPEADEVFQLLKQQERLFLNAAQEQDVIESQSADLAFGISAQQIVNRMKARGEFAPIYIIPNSHSGVPSRKVWHKNYLNPKVFRFFTWHGYGYVWFRWRCIWRRITYLTTSVLKYMKKLR